MRIEGVDLPRNKRVEVGLNYLFGIGPARSREILAATKISPDTRVKDLTESEGAAIREYIKKWKLEGDLRRQEQMNIKRLVEIGCYRGVIAATCLCTGSAPARMPAPARVSRRQLPVVDAARAVRSNPDRGIREVLWPRLYVRRAAQVALKKESARCLLDRCMYLHHSTTRL
jgi:ribosomal protein uS13